ncbi:hypothetical protein B296_00030416 [Ensete ventricosum]|uniref:Uncharacterized protein n=1 Tax=Ensete ventricosum TaxID=4639 RepID=A0A426X5C7_ENSVE|nr:hypothetical protein B296_00030416 [Ensete ventricosum]
MRYNSGGVTLVAGKHENHKRLYAKNSQEQPPEVPRRLPDRPEPPYPRSPPPPLNPTRMEIFLQIREKGLLRMPNPMKSHREIRDWVKYYHRTMAMTQECHDLWNQIDELIRKGYLRRYIKRPRETSLRPQGPVEKQIDVIV